MSAEEQMNRAYTERAIAAVLAAKMALRAGFRAGVAQDPGHEDWSPEWRVVLYVDLPDGQISWHIAPADQHLLAGLPAYERAWDGTFDSRTGELVAKMPVRGAFVPSEPGARRSAPDEGACVQTTDALNREVQPAVRGA